MSHPEAATSTTNMSGTIAEAKRRRRLRGNLFTKEEIMNKGETAGPANVEPKLPKTQAQHDVAEKSAEQPSVEKDTALSTSITKELPLTESEDSGAKSPEVEPTTDVSEQITKLDISKDLPAQAYAEKSTGQVNSAIEASATAASENRESEEPEAEPKPELTPVELFRRSVPPPLIGWLAQSRWAPKEDEAAELKDSEVTGLAAKSKNNVSKQQQVDENGTAINQNVSEQEVSEQEVSVPNTSKLGPSKVELFRQSIEPPAIGWLAQSRWANVEDTPAEPKKSEPKASKKTETKSKSKSKNGVSKQRFSKKGATKQQNTSVQQNATRQQEVTEPHVGEPEVSKQEASKPEISNPEISNPEITKPGPSKVELFRQSIEPPAIGWLAQSRWATAEDTPPAADSNNTGAKSPKETTPKNTHQPKPKHGSKGNKKPAAQRSAVQKSAGKNVRDKQQVSAKQQTAPEKTTSEGLAPERTVETFDAPNLPVDREELANDIQRLKLPYGLSQSRHAK
ncbi:hypothetical protein F4779DRAFT_633335 [Xylariaceae sp. FL0662B]|nr:hypothetical protein F4779DRAFT_633335 [Xylariaceae sp. FL0662B]